jgi:hypothetical protein
MLKGHMRALRDQAFEAPALDARALSLGFTGRYLELSGFTAPFGTCSQCGKIPREDEIWAWDFREGRAYCPDCLSDPETSMPLAPGLSLVPGDLLPRLDALSPETLPETPLAEDDAELAEKYFRRLAASLSGKKLLSGPFLGRYLAAALGKPETDPEPAPYQAPRAHPKARASSRLMRLPLPEEPIVPDECLDPPPDDYPEDDPGPGCLAGPDDDPGPDPGPGFYRRKAASGTVRDVIMAKKPAPAPASAPVSKGVPAADSRAMAEADFAALALAEAEAEAEDDVEADVDTDACADARTDADAEALALAEADQAGVKATKDGGNGS